MPDQSPVTSDLVARFLSPLGDDTLLFRRLTGIEELGRLPSYDVELLYKPPAGADKEIASDDMLGQSATVAFQVDDDAKTIRYINGYITHFERDGVEGIFDVYRLTLRPWLWYLTQSTDCKIFHRKTAVDILKAVFDDYGSSATYEIKVDTQLLQREFTVQYRESDFAFISRLMEMEGLYYYFTHDKDSHKLVICEGSSEHPVLPGSSSSLAWSDGAAADPDRTANAGVIQRWRRRRSVQPLSYSHTDFDAIKPSGDLTGSHEREVKHGVLGQMDQFDYPGLHEDLNLSGQTGDIKKEGERLAKIQVAGFQARSDVATLLTSSRTVAVGHKFSLTHHPDAGDYLITHAEVQVEYGGYQGDQPRTSKGFRCRVEAIPVSNPYQPVPFTETPTIAGPQTAIVVGVSGDEITTEQYGRIKVQFHWDRLGQNNEESSCWVRVCTPWASNGFGFISLPRIGDEVVIEFLEGHPDRPVIVGSVYNGTNLPPYKLPDHATVSGMRTRSSKGGDASTFNELRFEDDKGNEYIWFQAQKDYNQWVKNDAFVNVDNNAWHKTKKNFDHRIGENFTLDVGKVSTIHLKEDVHAALDADCNAAIKGALNLAVTEATAIKLSDAAAITVGQGLDVSVGQAANLTATSGVNVKGMNIVIEADMELTLKAGGSFVVIGPSGVSISGPMVMINSGGAAGSAQSAANASPAAPKSPESPQEQKDPLAS